MFRARVLPLLSALALMLGLGLAVSAPASAAPQLSAGCAQVHSHLGQSFGSAGPVSFNSAPYAVGEELVIIGFAGSGVSLTVTIANSEGDAVHLPAAPGQKVRIPISVADGYAFRLSGEDAQGEPAYVVWTADCGVPPTPAISPAGGQTYTPGQNVPTTFSCTQQTNPVGSCVDSNGETDGTGTLDTSTPGTHTYSVTGTDSSGLVNKTSISYTVGQSPQTITFDTTPPTHLTMEGSYTISATASSGLPVSYSAAPESADVCMVVPAPSPFPTVVYPLGIGTCTIHADQAGNDQYLPAPQVSQTFTVYKTPTTLVAQKACKCLGITPTTFKATLYWTHPMGPGTITEGLPGQPVSFVVKGKTVCSAVTDSNGLATCKATLGFGVVATTSSYTASYAGNERFEGSTATGKLE